MWVCTEVRIKRYSEIILCFAVQILKFKLEAELLKKKNRSFDINVMNDGKQESFFRGGN